MYAKLPYDPLKDFAPLTPVVSYVNVLVVNPNVPEKTVVELVGLRQGQPAAARQLISSTPGSIASPKPISMTIEFRAPTILEIKAGGGR